MFLGQEGWKGCVPEHREADHHGVGDPPPGHGGRPRAREVGK